MKLPRAFYARPTLEVARDLVGMHLVRRDAAGRRRIGRIVETEAYRGSFGDRAAHSFGGRTARNAVMFGPPGHAYVYFIYGLHFCFNVVTEPEGSACAVLVRALEPIEGISAKTSGPALLCRALEIDRAQNGADLLGDELYLEEPAARKPVRLGRSARIGVEYAGIWARRLWRFYDRASPYVSTARRTAAATTRARSATRRSRPTD